MFDYLAADAAGVNRQSGAPVRYRTDPRHRAESRGGPVVDAADRRVRRTRRNLTDALIGLILERGYEAITVQDILDRADIGRSTFYAHFRDKDALLLSCFDDLREDLCRDLDTMTSGLQPH